MEKEYRAIGLMSGSSLDGLDAAYCQFTTCKKGSRLSIEKWKLIHAETYPFSEFWKNRLKNLSADFATVIMDAHTAFGSYTGSLVNAFLKEKKILPSQVDFIASHGHTIFHQPAEGYTTQIGDGAALAATTRFTVINDFRSADIALGGQGAPLAPIADKMLFPGYDFYLNLGGIANLTCNANGKFIAFDICGANQILNALANELDLPFDKNGEIAASGKLVPDLLQQQLNIPFFQKEYPKSLSNQWVKENQTDSFLEFPIGGFTTLRSQEKIKIKLFTATELIAQLIIDSVEMAIKKEGLKKEKYSMMATGGGVFNKYLIDRIKYYLSSKNIELIIPEKNIVNFKEAVLMALMGVMRMAEIPNCMSSVTGASRDAIGGAVYL